MLADGATEISAEEAAELAPIFRKERRAVRCATLLAATRVVHHALQPAINDAQSGDRKHSTAKPWVILDEGES